MKQMPMRAQQARLAHPKASTHGDVESKLRRLRRHQRSIINVRAIVHSGQSARPTIIRDMSEGGVGLEGAYGLFPGSEVTVALVTGEFKSGVVRWWLSGSCGVQFHEPLKEGDRFWLAALRKAGAKG